MAEKLTKQAQARLMLRDMNDSRVNFTGAQERVITHTVQETVKLGMAEAGQSAEQLEAGELSISEDFQKKGRVKKLKNCFKFKVRMKQQCIWGKETSAHHSKISRSRRQRGKSGVRLSP